MLTVDAIRRYYSAVNWRLPEKWSFAKKHYRLETLNGQFVKLNRFRDRMRLDELRRGAGE